jgi:hypothetical protein
LSSTEAVDAFTLRFRCLLPLLLNHASHLVSFGTQTSAWPRIDFRFPLNAAAPVQLVTKLRMPPNFASPAATGDEFSDFPRILHPAARAARRISDFYRTFHLPAWQEMLLQLTTQLPTEVRVG